LLFVLCGPAAGAEPSVTYLYRLSDFSGPVLYDYPVLAPDRERGEILVAETDTIRVFGPSGMAVYEFEHDARERGPLLDVAVLENGDIVMLTHTPNTGATASRPVLLFCNFRGEPRAALELRDLPGAFAGFLPGVLRARGDRLYLASLTQKLAVATTVEGRFLQGWDLAAVLGFPPRNARDIEFGGFDVDGHGNLLVTVPVEGLGYRVSQEGRVAAFGNPGSGRGSLGVARGVAATDQGYILVADILNQLVAVFDGDLNFVTELPTGREGPQTLLGPVSVAAGAGGRVYVGEIGQRGVAVFQLAPR
jgi:hypothetical protein